MQRKNDFQMFNVVSGHFFARIPKIKKSKSSCKKRNLFYKQSTALYYYIYILTNEEFYKIVNILYLKNYKCHCHLKIIHSFHSKNSDRWDEIMKDDEWQNTFAIPLPNVFFWTEQVQHAQLFSSPCTNDFSFVFPDLLCVFRHKSNSSTHPKIITKLSEWEGREGRSKKIVQNV